MPMPCMEKTAAIDAPRTCDGDSSAAMVADSGYSPPMPKPSTKRHSTSQVTMPKPRTVDADDAWPIVAVIMSSSVIR